MASTGEILLDCRRTAVPMLAVDRCAALSQVHACQCCAITMASGCLMHRTCLRRYAAFADALAGLQTAPPADVHALVVRAGDFEAGTSPLGSGGPLGAGARRDLSAGRPVDA